MGAFLLLCIMKIFIECGGEGWWRRVVVFGDGSVGQTFFVLSRLLRFLVAVQDDSHDFLEGDGGG